MLDRWPLMEEAEAEAHHQTETLGKEARGDSG